MITDSAWLLAELVFLFFGVAFAIHILQRRIGTERLRTWMGGTPLVSALKGIAVGFVTPFCTYSAIPMLVGLRQAGVPPAGYVAFVSAAPVLDPVLFGALVVIVGFKAAMVYVAVAFGAALTLALTAQRAGIEAQLKPISAAVGSLTPATTRVASGDHPIEPDCVESSCGVDDSRPWEGLKVEAREASLAALNLLRSVALLLVAGVAIGLLIEALISPDTVASITGENTGWSIPVAAALGTPLYFHTSLFVPIADSLATSGVGIGAIVALTISGAGANVPEFIILTKLASHRLIAIFFAYVFMVALVGGLIAQTLLG